MNDDAIKSKPKLKKINNDINEDKKTEKYPLQVKYERNNPTITFRMKLHEKVRIGNMAKATGKSNSDLIRMALLNFEKDFSAAIAKAKEDGKNEGESIGNQNSYNQGYNKGKEDWQICCYCLKCKKLIPVGPNSAAHNIIIEKTKDIFICPDCKKNQIYSNSNF